MEVLFLYCLVMVVVKVTSQTEMCPDNTCDESVISYMTELIENKTRTLTERLSKVEAVNRDLLKKSKRHRKRIGQLEKKIYTEDKNGSVQINDEWGEWSEWTECTASCDNGKRWRYRECKIQNENASSMCSGFSRMQLPCNSHSCKKEIYREWTEWTTWTECSASCGIGSRRKSRTCENPVNATKNNCVGFSKLQLPCQGYSCPISDVKLENKCEWKHEDRCYAVVDSVYPSSKSWHANQCKNNDGILASMYDLTMLNKTNEYMIKQEFNSNYMWTGMTYSTESGLKFSNGTKTEYAPWINDNPKINSTLTAVVLRVKKKRGKSRSTMVTFRRKDPSNFVTIDSTGLINVLPTKDYQYSICEFRNGN